ncbi:MAG: PrsW family intramembrane metalloprotease [Elusimicrobia bacterium CG08_land_8_20_14_0_20_51_18]|nr:MAG: PrsW family intramembrane metalloprotease [Elusimicrobia bacterium CG08_land_8_20_14_0_20_51_18]
MLILALALGPMAAVAAYFYHRDKYEKEPLFLLLKAFFAGACVIPLVIVLELLIHVFVVNPASSFPVLKALLKAFLEAGLVEESCKFAVFMRLIYRNKEFNEPYDGILYSVMIALGFAFLENLFHFVGHNSDLMIYKTGAVRAGVAVLGHVLFGAVMGYYFSKAKFSADDGAGKIWLLKGLGIAVFLHGLYDFLVFFYTTLGAALVIISFYYSWKFVFRAIVEAQASSPFKKQKDA